MIHMYNLKWLRILLIQHLVIEIICNQIVKGLGDRVCYNFI